MKSTINSKDPDILSSLPAMKRAARKARKLAKATGTSVYVLKNGRVVDLNAEDEKRRKKKK